MKENRNCEYCGNTYTVTRRAPTKYCSRACSGAARTMSCFRACPWCSKSFKPKHTAQRCCSRSCGRFFCLKNYDPHKAAIDRFWASVRKSPSGCWLWTGAVRGDGYGAVWNGNRQIGAHRFSYQIHYGDIPDTLWTLHRCDTPLCVNPNHLYLGDSSQNQRDRWERTGLRKTAS